MISKIKITTEVIKSLTDEQLDELVYSKATDLYLGTFGKSFKGTGNHQLLKQIFATTVLDNEVRNGGFDQFFYNSGELGDFAFEGLKILGADQHADLCKQAIDINREQSPEFKHERELRFDSLDEQYYTLEKIRIKRQKFIRENVNKFMD